MDQETIDLALQDFLVWLSSHEMYGELVSATCSKYSTEWGEVNSLFISFSTWLATKKISDSTIQEFNAYRCTKVMLEGEDPAKPTMKNSFIGGSSFLHTASAYSYAQYVTLQNSGLSQGPQYSSTKQSISQGSSVVSQGSVFSRGIQAVSRWKKNFDL